MAKSQVLDKLRAPKRMALAALVAIIIGGGTFVGRNLMEVNASGLPTELQTATVGRGQIISTVGATGEVIAINDSDLSFQASGNIAEVLVKAGDTVKKGQLVAKLDTAKLEIGVGQARASLASAQASLEMAENGSATPGEVSAGQASFSSAQATLNSVYDSADAADIASAQASLAAAKASLNKVKSGATDEEIASAKSQVDQANINLTTTRNSASYAKEQARISMEQAANEVRDAQAAFNIANGKYEKAASTGGDPITGKPINAAQIQEYKDAMESALLVAHRAEDSLTKAQLNYEEAKQGEITQLATAQATLDEAQRALDGLVAGPDPEDVIIAEASVDQAQASLDKLQAGPKQSEIASAQAAVVQAQANLEKLTSGGTAQEVEISQTSVDQAEANLILAQLELEATTLTAPFDGVVTAVNVSSGQAVSSGTAVVHLTDVKNLQVKAAVSESDVARVRIGQAVQITGDALGDQTLKGTLALISPAATNDSGVVTYQVTVDVDTSEVTILPGATTNASIVVDQRDDALVVPNRAVTNAGGRKTVQVLRGDQLISVPVDTGLVGSSQTEILSGLQEGDTVAWTTTSSTSTSTSTNRQEQGPMDGGMMPGMGVVTSGGPGR